MASPTSQTPRLYALLIGIDCYLPNRLPDGSWYPNLGGCVRDVSHVEALLRHTFPLPEEHILKLTATDTGAPAPSEPRTQWPTYDNMVAAFKHIMDVAQPGDHVYIHYSGHGGRARTIYPERKGAAGIDEALVPADIGDSEARYLRDLELATLLHRMVAKGLVVAAVLDSCHSGGMTRGQGDVAVRGIGTIDTTLRSSDSLVGSHAELIQAWDQLTEGRTRHVSLGSGWLPEPKGYVLLAACRPSELAFEYAFDGRERNGALTYWLLDSLQDMGPGLSYKVLHDRIVAKVHSQFERQTPQLQGEGDRVVLGADRVPPHYAVPVMQVDVARQRVLLGAGQAHGLRQGAQFAIYPRRTTDFQDLDTRQAVVVLSELGAADSWATLPDQPGAPAVDCAAIEPGAQAVLIGAGSVKLVRQVSLVHREDLAPTIDQERALQAVEQALASNGWIEVAKDQAAIAYQVAINEQGAYEIWDRSGQPVQNLRPPLLTDDPHAPAGVARRLIHLAKYHAITELSNHDPLSPLARKLVVEALGKRTEYDPAEPFEPEPFETAGGTPTITTGEWVGIRIRNNAAQSLNITVFDLQPDWGARQIYPSGPGDHFVELEPGQEVVIPLHASLPEGYTMGKDVLKVFATVGTTNFRWLELPALDEPLRRSPVVRSQVPASPLEALLAAITAERPPTRNLAPAAQPSQEWVTAQVEIQVQREATGISRR